MKLSSLEKSLKILEYVIASKGGVKLMNIAKALSMTSPAAYKHVMTLVDCGYLYKEESSSKYFPSYKVVDMSSMILRNNEIHEVEHPLLTKLMEETRMTCHFVIRKEYYGIYIDKIEGVDTIPTMSRIGMKRDLYCTAFGKAILSNFSESELREYLNKIELKSITKNTIINKEELLKELENIKKRNYALDDEENELGIKCVGSAVFDYTNKVVGALSVIIPLKWFNQENIDRTAEKVIKIATEISSRLGKMGGNEK